MSGYCGGRFCGGGDAYEGFREMVWGCDVGSDGVWCVWQASMTPEERAATLVSVGERACLCLLRGVVRVWDVDGVSVCVAVGAGEDVG